MRWLTKVEMVNTKPVDPEVLSLLIKSLPGIPSELELYNFARSIEILHGIGVESPPLPATQEPRFI
jgi:hypothetical protein